MENLNAEQVISELEGLAKFRTCPEYIKDALALINSQEQRIKELAEENERLRDENSTLMADRLVANTEVIVCKMKLEALDHRYNRVKSDTVSEIRARVAVHFGTYCEKDQVKIADVFKLIDQIAKEMLKGDNSQERLRNERNTTK